MAIVVGTNSYVSLAEAEAYFLTRLDVAAWTEASEEMKEAALVTATRELEHYRWVGTIADPSQLLAWPRNGRFFDPRAGYVRDLSGVPSRVKQGQMELAYHFLTNDGVLDSSGRVSEVKVGPISVKGIETASVTGEVAYSILSPLLATAGGNAWWRAN